MHPPRRRHSPWLWLACCFLLLSLLSPVSASEEGSGDFQSMKSPVPYTEASLARGRVIYMRRCTECHGRDGKGQMDVVADATDLTDPDLYYNGTTEGEVFRSIRDGAGESMPPYSFQIRNEKDLWNLVNYVRSLWPEELRPQLMEE